MDTSVQDHHSEDPDNYVHEVEMTDLQAAKHAGGNVTISIIALSPSLTGTKVRHPIRVLLALCMRLVQSLRCAFLKVWRRCMKGPA